MWERIKQIPPFIAAIFAIAAAVIGAVTFVVGYFVSKNEFSRTINILNRQIVETKCISEKRHALLDSQLKQKISDDEVNNLFAVKLALENQNKDNVVVLIKSYEERIQILASIRTNERSRAEEIISDLANGSCSTSENLL